MLRHEPSKETLLIESKTKTLITKKFPVQKMCSLSLGECGLAQLTIRSRLILQMLLLAIFSYFFGLPAIEKYLRGEVLVVESSKDTGGIPLPAITIVERGVKNHLHISCFKQNNSIEDCIESNAYNLSDILEEVVLGFAKRKTLFLPEKMVSEEFPVSWAGRIFTLNIPLRIGPNYDEDQLFLFLSQKFIQIMLHDPSYFIFNTNPFGLPTVSTKFDVKTSFSHFEHLAITEVQEMDMPSDPCNGDQGYNFNLCVRTSIARQVELVILN